MSVFSLTWFFSTLSIVLAAYAYRSISLKRLARVDEFHWPGALVLSMLVGLAPAVAVDKTRSKIVPVPDGVGQKPAIMDRKN